MSKCLLINPPDKYPIIAHPTNRPPVDLLLMQAYLINVGIASHLIDIENSEISPQYFSDYISQNVFDHYVINTTGKMHHFRGVVLRHDSIYDYCVRNIISFIKRVNPSAIITLCGQTAVHFDNAYKDAGHDYVIYNDPEPTMEMIARTSNSDSIIPNTISTKKGKGRCLNLLKSLDDIPEPDWSLISHYCWDSTYRKTNNFIDIEGMRGCLHDCSFCKSGAEKRVLFLSPERIAQRVKLLKDTYGYTEFFFRCAGSFDDYDRCKDISVYLGKLDVDWKCNARIDKITNAHLKVMADNGCSLISYGCESGNDDILKLINKRITTEQIREVVHNTKQSGITPATYFIFGIPEETYKKRLKSLFFAESLDSDIIYISSYFTIGKGRKDRPFFISLFFFFVMIISFFIIFIFCRKIVFYQKIRVDNLFANFRSIKGRFKNIRWRKIAYSQGTDILTQRIEK